MEKAANKKPEEILQQPIEETGLQDSMMQTELSQEDVLKMFLEAADYKNDENEIIAIKIHRNGKQILPTFHVRPLNEREIDMAHKKATRYGNNPRGRRLPKIELETDQGLENAWIIYLATVNDDKEKLWNNRTYIRALQDRHPEVVFSQGNEGAQAINMILKAGEKTYVMQKIIEMSYPDDVGGENESDNNGELDYAKN